MSIYTKILEKIKISRLFQFRFLYIHTFIIIILKSNPGVHHREPLQKCLKIFFGVRRQDDIPQHLLTRSHFRFLYNHPREGVKLNISPEESREPALGHKIIRRYRVDLQP